MLLASQLCHFPREIRERRAPFSRTGPTPYISRMAAPSLGPQLKAGPRRILHVDVDAMFVQCAVLADPERLGGVDLILVGGSPSGRGVVTSASYGCRAYGVRSAMPTATALRLCPDATVVKVPGEMVRTKSRALASSIADWSPVAAMASVDEAYIDLTGTEGLHRNEPLVETARRIQRDLKERTGLDVSIGGAANRLVAKMATSFAKPAGVYVVAPGEEEAFVASLQPEDLIGVGPALLASLRRRGIVDMTSLRALDVETMAAWWGPDRARWLWRRCRGIDEGPIRGREGAKSISSETTFPRDVSDLGELERLLLGRVVSVAGSLRRQGYYARTITVKLRYADFRDRSRSRTLVDSVQSDRVIFSVARELLGDLRRHNERPVRLIGVSLTGLSDSPEPEQQSLIALVPPRENARDRALSAAVDRIRDKHGRVIAPGSVLADQRRSREGDG
ncbi:MAG: DNA polymerase IV [Gemmatimonas sp.]|nr:DNA polymerase IV [Gemmatimonas sp.]